MLILIIGGSGSGKSVFAEDLVCKIAKNNAKYYLATMEVFDEEGKNKIENHRKQREGKGFKTIEKTKAISEVLFQIKEKKASVLLECLSNLIANEMFSNEEAEKSDVVAKRVESDLDKLLEKVENLVVVSNNVFEDGILYDELTMNYNKALAEVNQALAKKADVVVEVVVGIDLVIKGEAKLREIGGLK